MILGLILAGVLQQSAAGPVLSGLLDFPVSPGLAPNEDCLGFREELAQGGESLACLQTPVGKVNDAVFAYRRHGQANGWADAGGAGNAVWMTRAMPDGTCQKLTIAGMWDFRRNPQPRDSDPGLVVLSVDRAARCPASPR